MIYSVIVSAPLDHEPEPDDEQEGALLGRHELLHLLLSDQKSEWKIEALKEYLHREWWVQASLYILSLTLVDRIDLAQVKDLEQIVPTNFCLETS